MFDFFRKIFIKEENYLILQINELEKVLKLSNKLNKKQISLLIKNLRKFVPSDRYNLTYKDLQESILKDKTIPDNFDIKSIKTEILISGHRASDILNTKKALKLGIRNVQISFVKEIPVCENMQKYKQRYDGKCVKLKKVPIFPLLTCFNCKSCYAASPFKKSTIKGFND